MTAAWDVGPCLWPDGPELDRQLAEADAAYWDRSRVPRVPPQVLRDTETVPIPVDLVPRGARPMPGPARQPLTRRQAEVLAAAEDGAPLAEVARRLGTSREQVASRLSEAYKRLDVAWLDREDRRAAAIRVARRRGLLPTAPTTTADGAASRTQRTPQTAEQAARAPFPVRAPARP